MSSADEKSSAKQPPTVAEADAFIKNAEARLIELSVTASRADWVKATYITDDTEILAAQADERAIAAQVDLAK
jgi:peptidyl-dipeptidase A